MSTQIVATEFKDKLGCYRVGDSVVYSKIQAIELHQQTGIHPQWDFNDAVFSSYNWKKEPSNSLNDLYRIRASQLREKYDYIVLMYSGGADSANVLSSFINNNIKLDEVASYINYSATGNKNNWLNEEITKVAIPNIEHIKETHPWLIHRLIDLTDLTLDYFKNLNSKFDWIYETNMMLTPNNVCRESLPLKIKEWKDIIDSGKKLCILWGKDKPRIIHNNNKFIFRFIDIIDDAATVKSIAGQQPYVDELFYWTPDLPEIVIKQAHVIKNYLSLVGIEELPFVYPNQFVHPVDQDTVQLTMLPFIEEKKSDLAFRIINDKKYWLTSHGVHSLIYPGWDINTLTCGKSPSTIFSNRDMWFFNIEEQNPIRQNWITGLDKLWKSLPDYWKNNINDISKGVKACWSRDYYLE
jgi:hypothetical protein